MMTVSNLLVTLMVAIMGHLAFDRTLESLAPGESSDVVRVTGNILIFVLYIYFNHRIIGRGRGPRKRPRNRRGRAPAEVERASKYLERQFEGQLPKDVWPKYISGRDYPPEDALPDLLHWIRTDDMEAYGRFRARVNVSAEDPSKVLHRQMLKLTPTLVKRIFDTLPGNMERSALREDLIRHWAKMF